MSWNGVTVSVDPRDAAWHKIDGGFDDTAKWKAWYDGGGSYTTVTTSATNSDVQGIGAYAPGPTTDKMACYFDEMRIGYGTTRAVGWSLTDYNTMKNPQTFISYGSVRGYAPRSNVIFFDAYDR
jgi:hypothetical protein